MDHQGGDMRKLLIGLALCALATALVPGLASANPQRDNSNGPHKDYMWGAATLPLPTPLGTFSANVTADGTTAPNGHDGVSGTFSTQFPHAHRACGVQWDDHLHQRGQVDRHDEWQRRLERSELAWSHHPVQHARGSGRCQRDRTDGRQRRRSAERPA